jgi:Leucine-rich repeat (LRR) protein
MNKTLSLLLFLLFAFAFQAQADDRAIIQEILAKTGRKGVSIDKIAEFNSQGRAVKLNLSKQGIDGVALTEIPPEVFKLTALKGLLLKNNNLRELPLDIGLLMDLVELDIGGNSEIGSLPASVGSLSNLRIFDARLCGLTGLPPEFGKLQRLETLQLWDNGFIMLPDCVTELKSLKELHLNRNKLISLPAGITKMGNLNYIDVQRNNLCDLPADIDAWLAGKDLRYKDHQWCK